MARRYWVKVNGRKHYVPGTLADLRKAAQAAANRVGALVQTGYDDKPARRTMRRNPDPGSFVDVWALQEAERARRLRHNQATKAKRLAKGLRRRGGTIYAEEAAKAKTARFIIHASNRKERFTLYRPSQRAAEALGAEFEAAGYNVTLTPA